MLKSLGCVLNMRDKPTCRRKRTRKSVEFEMKLGSSAQGTSSWQVGQDESDHSRYLPQLAPWLV